MTLRISLKDGEKMIVNGAVLRSVGRTDIVVENQVAILRGREVMSPEDATTPARRLYFSTMLAYIDEEGRAAHQQQILSLLADLAEAFEGVSAKSACVSFARHVAGGDYYRALADCRDLIRYETEALAGLSVAS